MSRALLRSVLELRAPFSRLVPSIRPTTTSTAAPTVRFFNQTAQHIESTHPDPTIVTNTSSTQQSQQQQQQLQQQLQQTQPSRRSPPREPSPADPKPISDSVRAFLPVLAAQPGHYATVHIHGRPYLVTEGDSVRLPFRMPGVQAGDVLRLNRASALGSRDLTLRGAPRYVDERLFECRAVVAGTESEPMRTMVKKKRRQRRAKRVTSKHRYTVLRISELKIRTDVLDEA